MSLHISSRTHTSLLLFALLACAGCQPSESATPAAAQSTAQAAPKSATHEPPKLQASEWVVLKKVVDGDTVHVIREEGVAKLRLLCIDTEERFHPGQVSSPGKPQTVFGEETAKWAEGYFKSLSKDGAPVKVGLCFPGGKEELDVFGRLLCHLILPDGSDYSLKLVREGRSPYFNKYGNSKLEHEAFVAAQDEARAAKLGIWNPETNASKTPGVPSAKRDYEPLLAWWDARAQAIADFDKRTAAGERNVADASDPEAVRRLLLLPPAQEIELFGELEKQYYEPNGELRLQLRGAGKWHVDLVVPPDSLAALASAKLDELTREYKQNFIYARGKLKKSDLGLELMVTTAAQIRRAGPEPKSVH